MPNRRQSRTEASDIRFLVVRIEATDKPDFTANILDATGYGMAVATPSNGSSSLATGQRVNARFQIGDDDVSVPGVIRNTVDAQDYVRYGIEFLSLDKLHDKFASNFVRRVFERRVAQRIEFPKDEVVRVRILDQEQGNAVEGTMHDISASGAAVVVPLFHAVDLLRVERVALQFKLPGERTEFSIESVVKYQRPTGVSTLLAMEFDRMATGPDEVNIDPILDYVAHHVTAAQGTS